MSANQDDRPPFDPVFLNARREALVVLGFWALSLIWIVGLCSMIGYDLRPEDSISPLGFPHWVLWGIVVPWLVAGVFSFWFALIYMGDDELGEDSDADETAANASPPEADCG